MLNVQVIGNLGSDAVIREFNGKKYVAFSVTHEKFTKDSQGNKVKVPVWVSVLWYGEGGNVFPLLKSGVKVFVHGREDVKMYDDKAGNKQIAINVEASEVFLCGMKGEGNQQAAPAQSNSTAAPTPTSSDNPADDLPF